MFRGKISLFGMVSAGLALAVLFSVPCAFAQEKADALEELSLYDLRNLEVSIATMTKTTVQKAPSIVSVISGEEIKNMGVRNLTDVFRIIPGFDVTHGINIPSHYLKIRGMNSVNNQKSKFMINGHWLNTIDGGSSYFMERIPIANIKKIEIIRGPGSALYGASAFLGVINIITKEGGDDPSEISLAGGSYETFYPYGEFSYKNRDFKVYLYADYYTTDGYNGIIESDMATDSPNFASAAPGEMTADGRYYNFQTSLSYNHFYFYGLASRYDINNPVGVARVLADEDNVDQFFAFGELGCKLPLKDKGNLLFKVYYDYFKIKNLWEIFPEETAALPLHTGFLEGEGLYGSPRVNTNTFGGEFTADYQIFSGIQVVGGILCDYYRQFDTKHFANYNLSGHDLEVNGEIYPPFPYKYLQGGFQDISSGGNWSVEEEDRLTTAVYMQGRFDLKQLFGLEKGVKNLTLTAGLRYDNYDDIGSTVNPRFGLIYAPTEKLYFKTLYGEAFRAPNFSEMYYKDNPNVTGNPDLDPETIRTMEALVGYDFSQKIRTSLTYFYYNIDGLIGAKDKFYQNMGKMEGSGIEGELKILFDKYKYGYFNFTWQTAKDTTNKTIASATGKTYTQDDFDAGYYAGFMANIGMNYDFFREHVIADISLNYAGEKDRSGEMVWSGETLVRGDRRDPTDDRWLLNASLRFRNFYRGMEFQISGFNLLDQDHREPDPAGALYYDMPQPGRWFTGRISYSF